MSHSLAGERRQMLSTPAEDAVTRRTRSRDETNGHRNRMNDQG